MEVEVEVEEVKAEEKVPEVEDIETKAEVEITERVEVAAGGILELGGGIGEGEGEGEGEGGSTKGLVVTRSETCP